MMLLSIPRLVVLAVLAVLLALAFGHDLLRDVPLAPLAALAWLGVTALLLGSWLRRRDMERRAADRALTLLH